MIKKPDSFITAYLTDSVNKETIIEHKGEDYNTLNYYTGNLTDALYPFRVTFNSPSNSIFFSSNTNDFSTDFEPYIHEPVVDDWEYVIITADFKLNSVPSHISFRQDSFYFIARFYDDPDNPSHYIYWQFAIPSTTDLYQQTQLRLRIWRNDQHIASVLNAHKVSILFNFLDISTVQASDQINYQFGAPRVFYSTTQNVNGAWTPAPNFETLVLDDVNYTFDNDSLLLEDFSLTESLCSQDNIKLGLCESAHIDFKCVTTADPKVGDMLEVTSKLPGSIGIPLNDLYPINWSLKNNGRTYEVTQGDPFFIYTLSDNGLADWTDYVDSLGLLRYAYHMAFQLKLTFNNVIGTIPPYFRIVFERNVDGAIETVEPQGFYNTSDYTTDFARIALVGYVLRNNTITRGIEVFKIRFYDENQQAYAPNVVKFDLKTEFEVLQINIGNFSAPIPPYDPAFLLPANNTLDEYICEHDDAIPLGHFFIDSVSNEYKHNYVEKKITAYDNLITLEQNAADWYTQYMFGVDTNDAPRMGFEFARQIYSTYINYAMTMGLDSRDNYIETRIGAYSWVAIAAQHLSDKYLNYNAGSLTYRIRYAVFEVVNPNVNNLYMVNCDNVNGETDEQAIARVGSGYKENIDPLGRGIATNGGVLIEETRANGSTAGFCVNRRDYFMLSPDCISFKIYIPFQILDGTSLVSYLLDLVYIYEVISAPRLVNGYLRLCYYNYMTKEVFACNSSITGRDVVRSLLEVCGCFFRLDRFNGLPEFVYPTKGGLYPSNTLFPADDLYPRSGVDTVYPMGRYMRVIAENYNVKDYGRIQILKDSKTNDAVSVCEWQYEGNPNAENTYIIDDNIFYCAEDMEYDYDNMPEVAQMLAGMYGVISNLGYTPNTTEAIGAPWLECGDRVGLLTYDGGFESFIFRRTLKGIQNLKDTYESVGDEKTEAVNDFGYKEA